MPKRLHVRPFTVLLIGLALLGGSASAQVVAPTSANTKSAVPAQDSPANPSIEDAPLTALPTHVKSGAPPVHGGFEVERCREVNATTGKCVDAMCVGYTDQGVRSEHFECVP